MKTDRKKRALLLVLMHILILAFLIWVWRCPFYFLSGIPCPGCGITRAYLSLLEGNIAEAFYWNPMFLPAGAVFLYAVHREKLPVRPCGRAELILGAVISAGIAGCWLYRLISGSGPLHADVEEGLLYRLFETLRGGSL